MAVSNKLEAFLSKLESTLIQGAEDMLPALKKMPSWASTCADLLYTDKSLPQDFIEPGQLFISFKVEQPNVINLQGKSKDQKPIFRNLKVEHKASSVTISSQQMNFLTDKPFTVTGSGTNFKLALDQYFSASDLKKPNYTYNTEGNIQKGGDAFLFPHTLSTKGSEAIAKEIVAVVREIFGLIPEEKHPDVLKLIEKGLGHFNKLVQAGEIKPLAHHYDARLWMIIDSICKHFDPLTPENDPVRQNRREHLIAECCSSLMRGNDIVPTLQSYLEALKMHGELVAAANQKGLDDELQKTIHEFQSKKLCPEIKGHHETIQEYHSKVQEHKKKEDPSSSSHFQPK